MGDDQSAIMMSYVANLGSTQQFLFAPNLISVHAHHHACGDFSAPTPTTWYLSQLDLGMRGPFPRFELDHKLIWHNETCTEVSKTKSFSSDAHSTTTAVGRGSLASYPGPAQLSIAISTASDEKLGGAWERG